jgi:5'-deoxynucleotidase YfbR-like HD superfamily hydrolase
MSKDPLDKDTQGKLERDLFEAAKEAEHALEEEIKKEYNNELMELKKQVKVYISNLKGQQISRLCKLLELLNEVQGLLNEVQNEVQGRVTVEYLNYFNTMVENVTNKIRQKFPQMVIENLKRRGWEISEQMQKQIIELYEEAIKEHLDELNKVASTYGQITALAMQLIANDWIIEAIVEYLKTNC